MESQFKKSEIKDNRLIFHVDMDAFFAAVEQRDHPEWRGKPVIIGGTSKRGVVATASYEAREYGIHSAMPAAKAHALCPHGIFVRGNYERYTYFSKKVFDILLSFSEIIQKVSIDEAYLDMTGKTNDPIKTADEIREKVYKNTGLTLSVGISFNRFLAKLASDWNKPNGCFWIKKDNFKELLAPLPIIKVHGLGRKTEKKLNGIGIYKVSDLLTQSESFLKNYIGNSFGELIYRRIRGMDDRPVRGNSSRKSYGKESTFSKDTNDYKEIEEYLAKFSESIAKSVKRRNEKARTICIKFKYDNFESHTRSKTLNDPTNDAKEIFEAAKYLLREGLERKIRLIGLSVTNLEDLREEQLTIWEYVDEDK